VLGLIGLIKAT